MEINETVDAWRTDQEADKAEIPRRPAQFRGEIGEIEPHMARYGLHWAIQEVVHSHWTGFSNGIVHDLAPSNSALINPHPSSVIVSGGYQGKAAGLTGLGPGGFGPPACRATMIWSTASTVRAASVASLMAQLLEIMRSRIPSSLASRVPLPSSF